MFVNELSKIETQFNRLSLFNVCSDQIQKKIFLATCCNDLRFVKISEQQKEFLEVLRTWVHSTEKRAIKDVLYFLKQHYNVESKIFQTSISIESTNWLEVISEQLSSLSNLYTEDLWTQSVLRNFFLFFNGLCPFLNFAFGVWQWEDHSLLKTFDLAELSTSYLYRLAPTQYHSTNNKSKVIRGEGAYCFISLEESQTHSSSIINKIPKNLAAEAFVNKQEALILDKLSLTPLHEHIPTLTDYDRYSGILSRNYIQGALGHELLGTSFFQNNNKSLKSLEKVYTLLKKYAKLLDVNLDIHPSNFIWSIELKTWFLIDLGPMPKIGSDYFPEDSFENYFKEIWLERYGKMKSEPIRSVDLY